MGKKSRNKGSGYELEVANHLTDQLGFEVRRNSSAYSDTCDIKVGSWVLECKRRAKVGLIYEAMEQAKSYCHEPKQKPMVLVRADGKKTLAIIELDQATDLIRETL